MSDLKKLVAQFMSELAKFEATTAQAPIAADEFSPEELADLTKVRNMGAKIRAKIAATAKPNAEIPKLEAVPFPQPEDSPQMTEAGNGDVQTRGGGGKTKPKKEEHIVANLLKSETHLWKMNIEGGLPEMIIFECNGNKQAVPIILGEEEPKIWKTSYPAVMFASKGTCTGIVATVTGKTKATKCFEQQHRYDIPNVGASIDLTVEIRWFGDGEKEFAIMINGATTVDKAKKAYWKDATKVVDKIQDETGSTFSEEDALFLDGNSSGKQDYFFGNDSALSAEFRIKEGEQAALEQAKNIFSKLKKDPNTGKIVQQIQVITHSRGSVYGNAFVRVLQAEIQKNRNLFADPDNAIDLVFHLDPHQPEFIDVQPSNHPTVVVDHDGSALGGINGMLGSNAISGDAYSMELKDEEGTTWDSHRINTYGEELDTLYDTLNTNDFNNATNKYEGLHDAFSGQITQEILPSEPDK